METDTIHDPVVYHVYSCGEHRILRKTHKNNAPCSRCGRAFILLASVLRNAGEEDLAHQLRALRLRVGVTMIPTPFSADSSGRFT